MKSFFTAGCVVILLVAIVIMLSCKEGNKLFYEPGVFVDEAAFYERKALWEVNKPSDYSYTQVFKYADSPHCDTVNVVVRNGVPEHEVVEIMGRTQSDMPAEDWAAQLEEFASVNFSIDALYGYVAAKIERYKSEFAAGDQSTYYARIDIGFDNELPYMTKIDDFQMDMASGWDTVGGIGKFTTEIRDFKVFGAETSPE